MKDPVSSVQVLDALRKGPFREPAHAWLYEVRNGTGYSKRERYADALVVSVWPSRGVWIGGIEVKVSRSDWKRELDDPSKAAAIQKWCDFWWIAAAEGVVREIEVPETWGFVELRGKTKVVTVREAPKLTPDPLDRLFVASVLRNQSAAQDAAKQRGQDEAWQRLREQFDTEAVHKLNAELTASQHECDRQKQLVGYRERDLESLRETVKAFEIEAGLPEGAVAVRAQSQRWGERHEAGAHFKAALLLRERGSEKLAERFRAVADALDSLTAEAKGAA